MLPDCCELCGAGRVKMTNESTRHETRRYPSGLRTRSYPLIEVTVVDSTGKSEGYSCGTVVWVEEDGTRQRIVGPVCLDRQMVKEGENV
jgi:hypothetical protein